VNNVVGPGNDTSTDSIITITDTQADSLIRTKKVRISESVQIVNRVRVVLVTALVRIPGPQCIRKLGNIITYQMPEMLKLI